MVVLFFATTKQKKSTQSNKEYAESIKKGVLKEDANKCMQYELSVMKDLQMSSLDSMLRTSDELLKVQTEFEAFLKGLEKKLQELQPDYKLTVNLKNKPHKVKEAILAFAWDDQKYPKSQKSIDQIVEKLNEKLQTTKGNLKTKTDDYYGEIEKLKQKQKSDIEARSYMKKDYREILKDKTDVMVKSKYLTTLLVFVPISNIDLFKSKYENLVKDCVVPGCALQLDKNEDEKVTLWRVVLMQHKKEEYVSELRKIIKANSKEYDEKEISILPQLLLEQKSLEVNIEEKKANLIQSLQSYFSEVYHATLHLVTLRLFTEATLKYGNGDYNSFFVIPEDGKEQKIIVAMLSRESEGDQGWYGTKEDLKDSEDFFPFILVKLNAPSSLKD